MTEQHLATTVSTPDGPFSLIVSEGSLLASGFSDDLAALNTLIHPSLRQPIDQLQQVAAGSDDSRLAPVLSALSDYYDGDLSAPQRVAVRQQSGEFRMLAWDVLRTVPAGQCISYTEYAQRANRPAAVRAAASACAMNAAALFVPCHRVRRSDGSLGGFRYGLAIKRSLLEREGFLPTA
ncbi:methylated-DNA--[protein]-cysteine S-methyltransferase [Glutamicibacter endophyticus]|uniref:methylated-DNA--[protein]-cysteine S-methyltransferase n=1 Tax=Glutamicibacter endophyticus TaxID=1522174 RepID=UPI003AF0B23D